MTLKNTIYWGGLCFLLCANCIKAQTLPSGFTKKLKSASVAVAGDTLIASTGKIERQWCLSQAGLRTVAVKDLSLNNEWGKTIPEVTCYWNLPGAIDPGSKASFVSLEVRESDDDGWQINPWGGEKEVFRYLDFSEERN